MLLWNVGIDASCILCKQHLETSDHLLFSCSYSQEVWSGLVQRLLSSLFSDHPAEEVFKMSSNKCHPAEEVFKMEKQLRLTGGLDKRSD